MTTIYAYTALDKPVEILQLSGSVDGFNANLCFDSGATASLFSHRLITMHNIPVSPTDIQIRSANNSIDEVRGITPYLTINVADHLCKLRLLVFDLGDIDVLFGLNWFRATGAGLFPAQKIHKFGDATVHLNNFGKEEDIEDINMLHARKKTYYR
jgi:hypothetical protein